MDEKFLARGRFSLSNYYFDFDNWGGGLPQTETSEEYLLEAQSSLAMGAQRRSDI